MSSARVLGILCQGLILGLLLLVAIWNLFILGTDARLFRYEGF